MAFDPKLKPTNLKPMKQPPKRKGYDIESIRSLEEAQKLLDEGKMTKSDWQDWIDLVFGY